LRLQSKIKLYLLLIAIAFLFKCIGIKTPSVEKIIHVNQGVLDLREWNFGIDGAAYLNGEWEYFPEQFDSLSIKEGEVKKFYSIGKDNFKNNSSSSYASFKVKILLPESSPENSLYIKVSSINSAYSLSVKDKVISSLGAVGKSKLDSTPWMGIDIASLPLDSNELELTLQTSDFYSNKNSLGGNLVIGTLKQLETSSNKQVFIGLSLILTIVFILLYNLSQISEKVSIALTISSISTILLLITSESNLLSLFFPISLGKIITEINTVCQFLILVCLAYCYYIISLALKTKWIRVLFNSVFLFFITGIILTNYFILPTIVERSVNFILIFLHLYSSFHFLIFSIWS
jgi:hypothetical protein